MQSRILVVDDQTLFREGLRRVLAECPGCAVVGEAADEPAAVALARAEQPDVVLMDLALPGGCGVRATRRLLEAGPGARVLVVSASEAPARIQEVLRAGARGFVSKSASAAELRAGVEAVRAGGSFLSPAVASRVARWAARPEEMEDGLAALSGREREVLACLAEGLSSREAGVRLGVSPRTVDSHRLRLMRKLGVRRVQALVRLAIREGLLEP